MYEAKDNLKLGIKELVNSMHWEATAKCLMVMEDNLAVLSLASAFKINLLVSVLNIFKISINFGNI